MGWWKRVTGVSKAQRKLSRKIGVPLSRSGRRKKFRPLFVLFGRERPRPEPEPETAADYSCFGCLLGLLAVAVATMIAVAVFVVALSWLTSH